MKCSTREKILAAASCLAREMGPSKLSLDAVAARAGVSKGGLLYNFPSKAALLQSLVEDHLKCFDRSLTSKVAERPDEPGNIASAYIELFVQEHEDCSPPPSGVLAAMAENPDFILPVRGFKRSLLDRMKASSSDDVAMLTIFLVLEGIRSMRLFDMDVLSEPERTAVIESLIRMASSAEESQVPLKAA
ncbi:TetR/AcrR family transcriptional regulator [Mesorhizobium sp. SB112]|uniref:TetR/AcrR family transcriptional regulator n=1 Tax=Mesorhizobium sp. SB112 TaxID=3151853 RepID=UPI0032633453